MNSPEFKLPPQPYPEHMKAIDLMIAHAIQRIEAIKTRDRITESPNPYGSTGKLTPKQRRTIASIGYRLTAAEIAERYGIHEHTVQYIRSKYGLTSGRRWGNQHTREER